MLSQGGQYADFACAAVIAMLVPFFNDVVGLLGAIGFWPLTVFLTIHMHLKQAIKCQACCVANSLSACCVAVERMC